MTRASAQIVAACRPRTGAPWPRIRTTTGSCAGGSRPTSRGCWSSTGDSRSRLRVIAVPPSALVVGVILLVFNLLGILGVLLIIGGVMGIILALTSSMLGR